MPRAYGQIQSAYWTHPDIRNGTLAMKAIGAYLLTGPHTNGLGCFYCPPGYIAVDIGIEIADAACALEALSDAGFLKRCEQTDYVWMPHFLKWNPIDNANVAKARMRELAAVPSAVCFHDELKGSIERFGIGSANPSETVPRTGSNSEPNRTEPRARARARKPAAPKSGKTEKPDPVIRRAMRAVADGAHIDDITDPAVKRLFEAVPAQMRRTGTERDLMFRFRDALKGSEK